MPKYNEVLLELFIRDLHKLKEELNAYKNEKNIWQLAAGISNSAGNLAQHLIGSTNHFFGATLGHTGYIRHRDAEFADRGKSRETLLADIDRTVEMMQKVLPALSNDDLDKIYPLEVRGKQEPAGTFLVHLHGHFNYHLGQINYHRRLLDK